MTVTFHENWFDERSQRALCTLLDLVKNIDGAIVEIGSWEGRSSIALANHAYPQEIICVDTWQGSGHEISESLAKERDVYAQWLENISAATQGNVEDFRMTWEEYFQIYHVGPIKFLFIDAEHTYEAVRDNIKTALPFMADRAIICGDDVHHLPVIRGVIETIGKPNRIASLWWKQIRRANELR